MKRVQAKEGFGFNEDFTISKISSEKHMMKLKDGNKNGLRTKVIVKNKNTGEVLFRGHNKTMIPGSEFMAMRLFRIKNEKFITPTYNTQIGLENTVVGTGNEMTMNYHTQIFCLGKDGCNRESAIWYPVSNKRWISPENLVPFQYVPYEKDLNETERTVYFGRKKITSSNHFAYYFKKFDSDPVLKRQFEDGTPFTASVYEDGSELTAQVEVTNSLTITKDDGRDYYINTTGINDARFNSVELCLAWTNVIGGYTYYQDIRPATRINFPNKYLNDLNAEFEIEYSLYF